MKSSINRYVLEILEQLSDALDAQRQSTALTKSSMADLLLLAGREPDAFFDCLERQDLSVLQALERLGIAVEDSLVGEESGAEAS